MKKEWNNPNLIQIGVEKTEGVFCTKCGKNVESNAGCGQGKHIAPPIVSPEPPIQPGFS